MEGPALLKGLGEPLFAWLKYYLKFPVSVSVQQKASVINIRDPAAPEWNISNQARQNKISCSFDGKDSNF